jgi:outer membrane receptor protein involved in Fe transport
MRTITPPLLFSIVAVIINSTAFTQSLTTVTGNVKNNKTKEPLPAVSVTIKNSAIGAYTDEKGNFKFTSTQKPPLTLVVSSIGFATKEVEYTGQTINVDLEVTFALGQDIVVAASRLPERILESPVTIERVSSTTIRNAPGSSYYDALGNLKGVDVTTSSYTFKTVSTRGFNGSGNLRFNQLVDGMDNAAPALNFSVGNVIGLTELDVDNMELLSGASSALYGSGGMTGTLLISSKDPFKYQGVSFQVKQGVMHINDYRHSASPFYDWSLRWGKKVSDKFAFKFGAQYIKADDWEADDTSDLLRTNVISGIKTGPNTSRTTDPNYDGVNVFGDEASTRMADFAELVLAIATQKFIDYFKGIYGRNPTPPEIAAWQQTDPNASPFYIGLSRGIYDTQYVSRTGYYEKDVVNYSAYNVKFSGGLYFNIHANTELSLTGNWGMGTSVYTGADRYSLKNFTIGQYKLELKSKNWLLRAYTTQENSGDSYASTLTALGINNAWKDNGTWFAQYVGTYSGARLMNFSNDQAHAIARNAADVGRFLPGTPQFKDAFDKSIKTPISEGGSQFKDKSSLYQFEGQYNLSPYIKVIDVLIGANYRWYTLNSNGTIFADTLGKINISEYGAYVQLKKALLNNVLTLTASGRYDKNENFEGRFTPRVTASVKVTKDNNIRLSYQEAYRFPNNQDQWINLQTPGSILIGCLPGFAVHYNFANNPVYTIESVLIYRDSGGVQANPVNAALLKVAEFKKAKPETVKSFEIGYRGVIANKLLIDAYFYSSKYQDFLGRSAVARGKSTSPDTSVFLLSNPLTSDNFSFVVNSPTPVKANGWGIGGEYRANKGYRIMANLYSDDLHDVPPNLITFFNTPKYRFNIGFANASAYKGLGFNVIYKWQDKIFWEGTFAAAEIPSFGTVDAQVSYKLGKTNNLIKLGATNLFNKYYRNAFGNPYIGGLYYVSFGYNVF